MNDKLTYEDLMLGEKRKNMYLGGKSFEEINKESAFYLNTTPVIYGLNVTDLGIAAVLGKTPLLLIGRPGCGKSQMNYDFSNYYFNGTGKEGNSLIIDGRKKELDIYEEIFTRLDKEKLGRVMTDYSKRPYFALEEFNRQPLQTQNQFLGITMGEITSPEGELNRLGQEGYSTVVATANIGNGEYGGTAEREDSALRDRFGVVLDFDYKMFRPTDDDLRWIRTLSHANPETKTALSRNISEKIIQANKEILNNTLNPSLEELSFMEFIQFGLKHCRGDGTIPKGDKSLKWHKMYNNCQQCGNNADGKYLCSLIRQVDGRTISALPKYATSLEYLIKLKNPKQEIDITELMFKAFELTGAYQNFLNPFVLRQKYNDEAPVMMAEVVDRLKADYNQKKDAILEKLHCAKKKMNHRDLFYLTFPNGENKIMQGKSELDEKINIKGKKETTNREILENNNVVINTNRYEITEDNIGYSWVDSLGDFIKINVDRNKNQNEKLNNTR